MVVLLGRCRGAGNGSLLSGRFRLFAVLARFVGRARGCRSLFSGGVLGRAVALGAVRLRAGVEVRVPAAALELEGRLTDQLLDLLGLALGADADRLVRHLLPFLELMPAGGTGVFVDGHAREDLNTEAALSSKGRECQSPQALTRNYS